MRYGSVCQVIKVRRACVLVIGLALLISVLPASTNKLRKIKTDTNPPRYVEFTRPLAGDTLVRHALDRLTFGARTGDAAELAQTGLDHWLNSQLHPDRTPENPILLQRLAPFESLGMSARQTYLHYPPPQMIAEVAHGKQFLPDDPELRAVVIVWHKVTCKRSKRAASRIAIRISNPR